MYTRCRVRTCANLRPVGLKSTALTTRPTWQTFRLISFGLNCLMILRPGIDPGPLAWKARMQPLTPTEQIASYGDRTHDPCIISTVL